MYGEPKGCKHGTKVLNNIIRTINYSYSKGKKYDNDANVKNLVYDDYNDLKIAKKAFAKVCKYSYQYSYMDMNSNVKNLISKSCERAKYIEKSMKYLGDINAQKLKNRIKKLKEKGLNDLTITTKLLKENNLYWAQMRYGKYGYEIQKKHLKNNKKRKKVIRER